MAEVWQLDACGQAEAIALGEIGPLEAVESALDQAGRLSELGAVTSVFSERARARAAEAEGRFAGVPILLKDAGQELAGTTMWMGTRALRSLGYVSVETTELAAQLEAAGFVMIGKAAVPELMTGVSTEPPDMPPARNPWNPRLTTGGSSGGSAAAVAAGIVPIAHGSDSTGSLRYPASCCGVFSLKPTAGRVSARAPGGVVHDGSHVDFVLARSVRDLQATLGELSKPSVTTASVRRVGVLASMPFGLSIAAEVGATVGATAVDLEDAGCSIVEIDPHFLEAYGAVLGAEVPALVDAHRAAVVDWVERQLGRRADVGDLSESILVCAERGRLLDETDVARSRALVTSAAATAAAAWVGDVDALLMPVLPMLPWPIGDPEPDGALAGLLCSLANFSGQPSARSHGSARRRRSGCNSRVHTAPMKHSSSS